MKLVYLIAAILATLKSFAQPTEVAGEEKWGVVLEHPDAKNAIAKRDLVFTGGDPKIQKLDIYLPADLRDGEKRPAVLFLPETARNKSWKVYETWARLVTAYGLIGIVPDVDRNEYESTIKKAFTFIGSTGASHHIDTDRLAVFSASHTPDDVINWMLGDSNAPGLKALALYYRNPSLKGPFRKDLPVLWICDDQLNFAPDRTTVIWNEVQKSKAPWTMTFGTGMPYSFELFADNDDARKLVRQTIYFFKNHLDLLPPSSSPAAPDREMIAAIFSGDRVKALTLMKKWLESHPDDQYTNEKYAMFLFLEKRYSEAEPHYKKVNNLHAVYMIDLVKVLYALNRPDEAEQYLDKALKSGQLMRTPYASLGEFLLSITHYSEALKYYQQALSDNPRPVDHYRLACVYAGLKHSDKAIESLKTATASGFGTRTQVESDARLESLKNDPRFKSILDTLK